MPTGASGGCGELLPSYSDVMLSERLRNSANNAAVGGTDVNTG